MSQTFHQQLSDSISRFHLPRYDDIPNVGLYLEQTVHYLDDYLRPLNPGSITGSMISNYVKKHLVSNPVHKQYNREQIAALFFIVITKSVLSLDNIATLLEICRAKYDFSKAYNLFCEEIEQELYHVFAEEPEGQPKTLLSRSGNRPDAADEELAILRSTIIAFSHKIYLDQWITLYSLSSEGCQEDV